MRSKAPPEQDEKGKIPTTYFQVPLLSSFINHPSYTTQQDTMATYFQTTARNYTDVTVTPEGINTDEFLQATEGLVKIFGIFFSLFISLLILYGRHPFLQLRRQLTLNYLLWLLHNRPLRFRLLCCPERYERKHQGNDRQTDRHAVPRTKINLSDRAIKRTRSR
jgi:hypothetical protein